MPRALSIATTKVIGAIRKKNEEVCNARILFDLAAALAGRLLPDARGENGNGTSVLPQRPTLAWCPFTACKNET
jgi:hypothetical protein